MGDWLDDDEMRAWRGMIETFTAVRAVLERELIVGHGIDEGDYGVLVLLSEAPDHRLRMCDLASLLLLSPSGITRRIDGLVRVGIVARLPATDDRRVMLAALTPEGMRKLEAAAPDHLRGVRRHFFDHLTTAQIRQLGVAMAAVRQGER